MKRQKKEIGIECYQRMKALDGWECWMLSSERSHRESPSTERHRERGNRVHRYDPILLIASPTQRDRHGVEANATALIVPHAIRSSSRYYLCPREQSSVPAYINARDEINLSIGIGHQTFSRRLREKC